MSVEVPTTYPQAGKQVPSSIHVIIFGKVKGNCFRP